jgi:hypothetical protein
MAPSLRKICDKATSDRCQDAAGRTNGSYCTRNRDFTWRASRHLMLRARRASVLATFDRSVLASPRSGAVTD